MVAGFNADLVQGDSVAVARQLVEHLIELRHRRIGMVTETTDVSTARDRLQGYREALGGAGTVATQLLLDRLSGRVAQRRRIVVLPADFVVRKSSGANAPAPAETG